LRLAGSIVTQIQENERAIQSSINLLPLSQKIPGQAAQIIARREGNLNHSFFVMMASCAIVTRGMISTTPVGASKRKS
jgi:hypothetical protein